MSAREESGGPPPPAVALAGVDELEVVIEKLVAGGDGLARHGRVPIFVPRSVPGDRLRVRIVERRPDYGRGEIVEVIAPGAGRREPPCPHFERCGGCDLQQIEDGLQTEYRVAAVRETLERLARIAWPEEVEVIAGESWGYRLRCGLRVERRDGELAAGYRERGSHRLVPISSCPILAPELEAVATTLPALLGEERAPQRIDLSMGEDGRVTAAPMVPALGRGGVTQTVDGITYAFDARTFFQAHRGLLGALVRTVVGEAEGGTAVDLYAGVGLFSLPLAHRYARVIAVEGDRVAVRYLRQNARRNGVELEVAGRAVETWIRTLPEGLDRVVADPPRRGLGRPALAALLNRRPRRLTYVSCHPAALARDLLALGAAYRLERLTLLDLFPQTGHMEVVAQLVSD